MKKLLFTLFLSLTLCAGCSAKVKHFKLEVVNSYSHDIKAYTQGLFFHDDYLYESTGQWGESSFRKLDLESGKVLKKLSFDKKYFVEGSVILDGMLYILTWTNKLLFVYDAATLEYKKTYRYPREGWGLTTDGKRLIASDGSSTLYYMDQTLQPLGSVEVKMEGRPVRLLNELEWIDGKIWANVYTTDMIMIINPQSGNVEAVVDCTGLLPNNLRTRNTDVLNGIAEKDGRIYLTGKYWPRLYEVRLVESR